MQHTITKGCLTVIVDRVYKISAFGDFASISATPDNMQYFFDSFREDNFLPSVYQELQINVMGNQNPLVPIPSQQRIMLISSDDTQKISIGSNRIDFEISTTNDVQLLPEQRIAINQKITNAFAKIFEKFNKTAARLALNTESLVINLSPAEYNHFLEQYSNPLTMYNNVPLGEWGTRLMIRKAAAIGDVDETFNVITNIQKKVMQKVVNGEVQTHDGFGVSVDINTIAENSVPRFTSSHIQAFIDCTTSWWDSIISELDGAE